MHFNLSAPKSETQAVLDAFRNASKVEVVHCGPGESLQYRIAYDRAAEDCWELPQPAAEALFRAWPDQVDAIMQEIRPCIGDFYGFNRWGMFVGVEPDGYIHT